MNFDEGEKTVPETIKIDSLWKMRAYRLALYLSDLCWRDVEILFKEKRTAEIANQLYRLSVRSAPIWRRDIHTALVETGLCFINTLLAHPARAVTGISRRVLSWDRRSSKVVTKSFPKSYDFR